jgi:Rrf2 family iron-responsive transcriptional regulator
MRLTKQTNYAVCALIYCAMNEPALSRVKDIAKAYSISELFLFKIITPLVENGMIETVRGRRGGIRLAQPAKRIKLVDVVTITEDGFSLFDELERGPDNLRALAGAYPTALDRAMAAFLSVLAEYSVADLAEDPEALRVLLDLDVGDRRPATLSFRRRPKPVAVMARKAEES